MDGKPLLGATSFYNITNAYDEIISKTMSPWCIQETKGTITIKGLDQPLKDLVDQ